MKACEGCYTAPFRYMAFPRKGKFTGGGGQLARYHYFYTTGYKIKNDGKLCVPY